MAAIECPFRAYLGVPPMADLKNSRYIIKHVDGVMHLTLNPAGQALGEIPLQRTMTTAAEKAEQKK
jgi:hypothetical protein